MKKYKLIGITSYAERHLSVEDEDYLRRMIGCTVHQSDNKAEIDGGILYVLPDGEETHQDFLIVEPIL